MHIVALIDRLTLPESGLFVGSWVGTISPFTTWQYSYIMSRISRGRSRKPAMIKLKPCLHEQIAGKIEAMALRHLDTGEVI